MYIDAGSSGYAFGAMGSVRASGDTNEFLACTTSVESGSAASVFCEAIDASNNYGGCSSTNPAVIATVAAMNADSFLWFEWNASGVCTYVEVITSSSFAPKAP